MPSALRGFQAGLSISSRRKQHKMSESQLFIPKLFLLFCGAFNTNKNTHWNKVRWNNTGQRVTKQQAVSHSEILLQKGKALQVMPYKMMVVIMTIIVIAVTMFNKFGDQLVIYSKVS